jgi:hypothetical protein
MSSALSNPLVCIPRHSPYYPPRHVAGAKQEEHNEENQGTSNIPCPIDDSTSSGLMLINLRLDIVGYLLVGVFFF